METTQTRGLLCILLLITSMGLIAQVDVTPPTITCPSSIFVDASDPLVSYIPPVGIDDNPGAVTTLISGIGQGRVFSETVVSGLVDGARDVFAEDLDGDGDLDVLSASRGDSKIAWYENLGGSFGPQQLLASVPNANEIKAADLDGDGLVDVVASGGNLGFSLGPIGWLKNLGGGSFGPIQPLSASFNAYESIFIADLDGDADNDILVGSRNEDKVLWYENMGSGVFSSEQLINTSSNGVAMVYAADLDNDNDLDVLSASFNDQKIAWHENLGGGSFGPRQVVQTTTKASGVLAIDYDGDGDQDIISYNYSSLFSSSGSFKIENLGGGTFGPAESLINDIQIEKIHAADLDNDGDIDLAIGVYNDFYWAENQSGGSTFVRQDITGSPFGTSGRTGVFAADINGNGSKDIICAAVGFTPEIQVWESTPTPRIFPNCTTTETYLVTDGAGNTATCSFNVTVNECPADIVVDRDLDNCGALISYDLKACPENKLTLLSGLGRQRGLESPSVISSSANGAQFVFAADLNNDGDVDVISSSQNDDKVAWYENLGDGTMGPEQVITTSADLARGIFAADLNDDGNIDVVSASLADDKIAWYENLGGGSFGPQQIVDLTADGANAVFVADIDGDSLPDILSSSFNANRIAWHRNLGSSFSGPSTISSTVTGSVDVSTADLDGDGDQDVLSASAGNSEIAWHQNDGSGVFAPKQLLGTIGGARSVGVADLDFDGDLDVHASGTTSGQIVWFENLGGSFASAQLIANLPGVYVTTAEDIDLDGEIDLVASSSSGNLVVWYKNLGSGTFSASQEILSGSNDVRGIYTADLNGDDYPEVIGASNLDDEIISLENVGLGLLFEIGTTVESYLISDKTGSTSTCSFNVIVNQTTISTNDDCACAEIISGPGSTAFCTNDANDGADPTSCVLNDLNDLWYTYVVPDGLEALNIYTCGSDFDTGLSLWSACGGSEISCNDDGALGGGSTCGGSALQSLIQLTGASLDSLVGLTIYIRVSGFNNEKGCGDLIVEEITSPTCDPAIPPANFSATVDAGLVEFSWDPVQESIGCQLQAGPLGSGFPFSQIIFGSEVDGLTLPASGLPPGNYHAKVKCACTASPLVVTDFSNVDLFIVPSLKVVEGNISLFPNPATNTLTIEHTSSNWINAIEIIDIYGRVLQQLDTDPTGYQQVDLTNFSNGLYIVKFIGPNASYSKEFQVLK